MLNQQSIFKPIKLPKVNNENQQGTGTLTITRPPHKFHKLSDAPIKDIEAITYEGQDPRMRQYKSGYEMYLEELPVIEDHDVLLEAKEITSLNVMKALGYKVVEDKWIGSNHPGPRNFDRFIIAVESPRVGTDGGIKEGAELVVARWGDGFASPIHGHAPGYIHEELLHGQVLVMTYRLPYHHSKKVRPVSIEMVSKDNTTIVSAYYKKDKKHKSQRHNLIHNFRSIGRSATLHYLSEHTRDGRDNGFEVEYFDDSYNVANNGTGGLTKADVTRITSRDGLYLRKGEVVLVRSSNVPYFGAHYIVITGHPIMKEHGMRPQDVAIPAVNNKLLDAYSKDDQLVLLKLKPSAQRAFLGFHGIKIVDGEVVFPTV